MESARESLMLDQGEDRYLNALMILNGWNISYIANSIVEVSTISLFQLPFCRLIVLMIGLLFLIKDVDGLHLLMPI